MNANSISTNCICGLRRNILIKKIPFISGRHFFLVLLSQSSSFLDLITWCRARYDHVQRTVMTQDGKILITVTAHSINQMLMIPSSDSLNHFSPAALMDLSNKLTFPQRALILELFLPKDVELLKRNPPYSSSVFPEATRHIISLLSYLLGYENDQLVDESILEFFSIFSKEYQPSFMYNYSQCLVDNIHEQFMNFTTQRVFRYSLVIIHLILFQ